eukprot:CAMPEP_0115067468 /NCGR_PEP_ID=MMETSP0227-20121206/11408_1 /TAXON_ID=89957 /ORGANISM="Polarella glacialis, Strain CCMP 1383" /LENGTH=47 /DNA_ID= /DNA_START= /DNA_END= /DNA_ORIENTATION=
MSEPTAITTSAADQQSLARPTPASPLLALAPWSNRAATAMLADKEST